MNGHIRGPSRPPPPPRPLGAPLATARSRGAQLAIERTGADVAQLAGGALGPAPDALVELLHAVEQDVVGRREAELEVTPARALRAQASAGPVGAAEVEKATVDDDRLEVNARAQAHREGAPQARLARQLALERPRGRRRVQDAQLDALPDQVVEDGQHGAVAARGARRAPAAGHGSVILDHELLQVGRRDPDAAPRLHDGAHDMLVVPAPADEARGDRAAGLEEVQWTEVHGRRS